MQVIRRLLLTCRRLPASASTSSVLNQISKRAFQWNRSLSCTCMHSTQLYRFDCGLGRTHDPCRRHLSLTSQSYNSQKSPTDEKDDKDLTVFQRFTKVYKEYGKTLIVVHVVTSVVWFGGFYVLARSGIDLMPLLVKLGASEAIRVKVAAAGDFLVAYIIYELMKPVRYLLTLAATRQCVVYLRKIGYLPPLKPEDKLRNLAKDGRDSLKDKYQEQKDDIKERYAEKKEEYKERWRRAKQRGRILRRHMPRHLGPTSRHPPGSHLHSSRLDGSLHKHSRTHHHHSPRESSKPKTSKPPPSNSPSHRGK